MQQNEADPFNQMTRSDDIPVFKVSTLEEYCSLTSLIARLWTNQLYLRFTHERATTIVPWFRGVSNRNYSLTPTLARAWMNQIRHSKLSIFDLEDYYYDQFINNATPLLEGKLPADKIEWNCLMRQHKIPSRLLDWSKGSLIALFYATEHSPPKIATDSSFEKSNQIDKQNPQSESGELVKSTSQCSTVWMLEPKRLMELATECLFKTGGIRNISTQDPKVKAMRNDFFQNPRELVERSKLIDNSNYEYWHKKEYWKYPLPLIPRRISQKLQSSLARFTIHSLMTFCDTDISMSTKDDVSLHRFALRAFHMDAFWYLIKIEIPADCISCIARDLRMTGVVSLNSTMSIEDLAQEITLRAQLEF